MGRLRKSLITVGAIIVVFIAFKLNHCDKRTQPPKLEETWWGRGEPGKQDKSIREFRVNVSAEVLHDLKYRLENAREFTPPLEGIAHQYGMNTNLLKEVLAFWKTNYNWREREKLFNKYPQFVTNIQGLDIHYIHVKPKSTNVRVLPLLLLHGWPGSIREFFEAIPLLTTPNENHDFVFEVIVASLPGYGFSDAAVRPGLGAAQIAVVFKNLMNRLGFERYYVQGGDFGGTVLQHLSVLYPDSILGFHSNMCTVYSVRSLLKMSIASIYRGWFTKTQSSMSETLATALRESGYFHLQATKPDTIGVALKDSPVGLAAYILEKFTTATNATYQNYVDGGLKKYFGYAPLLDNIMVYWITGSMPTAMRLYAETLSKAHFSLGIGRMPILVPTACARFSNDFPAPDEVLSEIYSNLLHVSDHQGGHFAAFQLPEVLTEDVFEAVSKFEKYHAQEGK